MVRQWRLTVREVSRRGNSRATRQAAAADERPTHARPGRSNSDQAATLVGAAAAALCIQLDAVEDDAFTERAMLTA